MMSILTFSFLHGSVLGWAGSDRCVAHLYGAGSSRGRCNADPLCEFKAFDDDCLDSMYEYPADDDPVDDPLPDLCASADPGDCIDSFTCVTCHPPAFFLFSPSFS